MTGVSARRKQARLILGWFVLELCCWSAAWAADQDCQVLSTQSEADLQGFRFDHPDDQLAALDPAQSYVLGDIRVVRQSVFEAPENSLQQLANRYHINTRNETFEAALTVATGQTVDRRALEEAERSLRGKLYLFDARIIARRVCGTVLDIDLVTRDVWTLLPSIVLEAAGGDSSYGIGITDGNWFGRGKTFTVHYLSEHDRDGVGFYYGDPNLWGSRWTLGVAMSDNDDGHRHALAIGRPFYSLDTRRAYGLRALDYERDEGLYFLNDKFWEFSADSRQLDMDVGFSRGMKDQRATRWSVGVGYESDDFEFPAFYPYERPENREKLYPFVGVQMVEDRFDKRVNILRVHRTEDLNVGLVLSARLGWSSDRWGGRDDRLIGSASIANGRWLADTQLLSYGGSIVLDYALDDSRFEDLLAAAYVSYTFNHAERFGFSASASFTASNNLPVDKQLLLGGDTGLRGYPTRYQPGDRRYLLTLEERYYSDIYPFQLFRVGWAAFLDVGRAWYEDDAPDWLPGDRSADYLDVLSNVGVGMRIESTRTRRDLMLHLDFAVPLRDGPNVSGMEVTLSLKRTF